MKITTVTFASLLVASASAFVPLSGPSTGVAFAKTPGAESPALSSTRLSMASDTADYVDDQISSNEVMVFSKSYCPFCDSTKRLFENMDGVDANIVEVDQADDGDGITAALLDKTGQRTFPNVFVKGTHIGGNDETQLAAKMGKIKKILSE
jgi:glutaredoxin 3